MQANICLAKMRKPVMKNRKQIRKLAFWSLYMC